MIASLDLVRFPLGVAERDGGWFSESWFARFAIEDMQGSWGSVTAADPLAAPAPATR